MLGQSANRGARQRSGGGVGRSGDDLVPQGLDQQFDVIATFAERRQFDDRDVETVVEVFAKGACLDHGGQIAVGGGDDADVGLDLVCRAERTEFRWRGVQRAEQASLHWERKLADFVEEQGPAVGLLKPPRPIGVCAGVRALLGSEELGVDQRLWNRTAIDRHEGPVMTWTSIVKCLRKELLARAGLAEDQDRNVLVRVLRHLVLRQGDFRARPLDPC